MRKERRMQTLPAEYFGPAERLSPSQVRNGGGRASFAGEFLLQRTVMDSAGKTVSARTVLANAIENFSPLEQAPYSANLRAGDAAASQEIHFTKRELMELHRKLESADAPTDALRGLADLTQRPDGGTMGQVLAALHPVKTPLPLPEEDQNNILSLAGKIDPEGALGPRVLELLQSGEVKEAWEEISAALKRLPPEDAVAVDHAEAASLLKAMDLSPSVGQEIMGAFDARASLALSPAGIDKLMTPAWSELLTGERNWQKLDRALDVALQPVMEKARKRMELEKSAGERSSRRVEQSEAVLKNTAMRNVNAILDDTHRAAGERSAPTEAHARTKAAPSVEADEKGEERRGVSRAEAGALRRNAHREHVSDADPARTRPASDAENGVDALRLNGRREHVSGAAPAQTRPDAVADADKGKNPGSEEKADRRDGWEPLLRKTEARQTGGASADAPAFGAAAAVMTAVHDSAAPAARTAAAPREALSQVEQAMLTALHDGSKRLQIQLEPGELGALTLTLTSRNGEVSALIRSDRNETADMIARQLDVLRTNLEQQGVKVDKLEVRNQGADNNAPHQWDSAQQHNARQEEYARRDTLDRLRVLARARNDGTNSSDNILEQGMQSESRTAENSAQRIYLIA